MAEADTDRDAGGAPKKKPIMLIVVVANVVLIGGVAAFLLLGGKGAQAGGAEMAGADQLGKLVQIPSFIVNLNEPRSTRYLKVTITVELGNEAAEQGLQDRKDIVRDKVLTALSGLSIDDVRGADTKETIRQLLVQRINEALAIENGAKNVLFTEFVVQ